MFRPILGALLGGILLVVGQAVPATAGPATSPSRLALAPAGGTLRYPVTGQTGVDAIRPFIWSRVAGAQGYDLIVGTTRFGSDVAQSGVLPAVQSSYRVPALPINTTLYATLLTELGSAWVSQDVSFTTAPGDALLYPVDGQANVDGSKPFRWSTISVAQGAVLAIGTTKFGTDVLNTGLLPPRQTSFTVPPLPKGKTLFATLLTKTSGGYTRYQAIIFTTAPATGPAMVTLINNYFAAVQVGVGGQTYNMTPGQQIGPVAVTPAASGNDVISVTVLANPSCGLGDASKYFDFGGSYRLTVTSGGGTCSDLTSSPNFTVTPM